MRGCLPVRKPPQGTEARMTMPSLAVPIYLENVLKNLMGTVNVLILSALSDQAVAAVGVSTQVFQMALTVFSVCANGAVVVICQNLGAKSRRTALEAASTALFLCSGIALCLSAFCFCFAPWIIQWMQVEAALYRDAVEYLRILSVGGLMEGVIAAVSGIMRSYGKPRYTLCITVIMNLLNAAGGWLVVFQPMAMPLTGIVGVAWMRVVSEAIAAVLSLFLLWHMHLTDSFRSFFRPKAAMVKPILRIALPAGVETLSYSLSQTVTTAIVATLGVASISAKIYIQNIVHYVYLLGLSIGNATAILIGHRVGAGAYQEAAQINRRALRITLLSNAVFSLLAMALRYPLLGLFTHSDEVIAIAAPIMILDFFVELGRGTNHVEQNSLRAIADVKVPMLISVMTSWGCSILFSYLLGVRAGLGLMGCWIAYGMEEIVRCTLLRRRWHRRMKACSPLE